MKSVNITAPDDVYSIETMRLPKVFLAGGITNCPDWQKEMIKLLSDQNIVTYNPRRENFPMDDPDASNEQITWEHKKLADADVILFWFAKGSINPIVLYELGRWGNSTTTPIVIGVDPDYIRKQDVKIQTILSRHEVEIQYSLQDLAIATKKEIKRYETKT